MFLFEVVLNVSFCTKVLASRRPPDVVKCSIAIEPKI